MDTIDINKLFEEVIADFEKSETHSILFYSTDKTRDFTLLSERVKAYKKRLGVILANDSTAGEIRDSVREGDLQT